MSCMAPHQPSGSATPDAEVMAAHDEDSDAFVIADIARENAWLSVRTCDAPVLSDWA